MIFKFIKKTSTENYQFMKFIFIGGINTLFGYGVYLFFLFFGLNFAIAALVSTILGIIFNFFTTGRFVFNSKNNSLFFRFILVYVLIYFFTVKLFFLRLRNFFYGWKIFCTVKFTVKFIFHDQITVEFMVKLFFYG